MSKFGATARAEIRAAGNRLALNSAPPILLRSTRPGVVYTVQALAGPLGGDELELDIEVAEKTDLTVHGAASSIVQPGTEPLPMRYTVTASVAGDGVLRWLPEPTVVANGADYRAQVHIRLRDEATVVVREIIALGRFGEVGGRSQSLLSIRLDGEPVLRNESIVDGTIDVTQIPTITGGRRVLGSLVIAGKNVKIPQETAQFADQLASAVLPLAGPGYMVTVVGDSVERVRHALDDHSIG
jgi:urease accessory protein